MSVVILCVLVQALDGFDAQAMTFVAPVLRREWHLTGGLLGSVFSATSVGTLIGCIVAGPMADTFGRKPVMVGSLAMIAVLATLTGTATTARQLLLLRGLVGIPLGALIPVSAVMMSEWSPIKARAAMVVIIASGYALGASGGGLLASFLLPAYGWRSVMFASGTSTGILCLSLISLLPESLLYLGSRPTAAHRSRISRIVRRFDPGNAISASSIPEFSPALSVINTMPALFRAGRASITVLLAVSFFLNMIVVNFLSHWLPTLLSDAGLPVPRALRISSLFFFGSIAGGLVTAAIVGRAGVWYVGMLFFAATAVAVALTGTVDMTSLLLPAACAVTALTAGGMRHILIAVSTMLYPTAMRSSGAGMMLVAGHVASIVGPLTVGGLLSAELTTRQIFLAMSLTAVVGTGCFYFLSRRSSTVSEPGPGRS